MVSPAAIVRRKASSTQALERQDRRLRHARRFLIAHAARLLCPGPLRSERDIGHNRLELIDAGQRI